MDLLKSSCIPKQFVSFKSLPIGVYKITKFAMVETQYGTKVRAEIGHQYVFLPQRMTAICEAAIDELNQSPKIMVYSGRVASQHNR